MIFCTACGNSMSAGVTFCTKCGAKMTAVPGVSSSGGTAVAPARAPQPQKSGSNPMKMILAVVAALAVVGAVAIGGVIFVSKKAINNATHSDANGTSVNIPGAGKLETLKDPALVASKLGMDVYPGSTVNGGGASSMTIGGVTTTHAGFETEASSDDVFAFYKSRYPAANIVDTTANKTLMYGSEDKELLTVTVEEQEGKTLIHVTKITRGSN